MEAIFEHNGCSETHKQWTLTLTKGLEDDEFWAGIKLRAIDKAPCLDGYTMTFFHAFWELVKEDLMLTFHNFIPTKCLRKIKCHLGNLDSKEDGGKWFEGLQTNKCNYWSLQNYWQGASREGGGSDKKIG